MIRLLLFLLPAAIGVAQDSDTALRVPTLGYLVSVADVSVRPIVGSPGAVVLGPALPLPDGVTRVVPAPGQPFAIVECAGAAESGVLTLSLSGSGDVLAIANTFAHSDRIAFSPSGAVAVLYAASTQQAEVITGLPSSPQLSRTVDLSQAGLPLTSIAVSDDAQAILAGVSDGTRGAIWTFAAGQSAQEVTAAGNPSALRFFSGKQDAVAADKGWQQVLLLPAGAAPQVLAGAVEGIHAPADLEISTDQQTVWVADANAVDSTAVVRREKVHAAGAATGQLVSIGVTSGAVGSVASSVAAATLTRLAGDSVFLLTSKDGTAAGVFAPLAVAASVNAAVWRLTGVSVE